MIYSYLKKDRQIKHLDKLFYYLKFEKMVYYSYSDKILIIIDNRTSIVIINNKKNNNLVFETNNKLLNNLIKYINSEEYYYNFEGRIEDSIILIKDHLEKNKKIHSFHLSNTLDNLKEEYIKNNNFNSYVHWQILNLNECLFKIDRYNKDCEVFSISSYPIIEISQIHILGYKKVIVYIEYNFFTEIPLKIDLNCNYYLEDDLIEKIKNLNFFKESFYWKDDYNLEFINKKIYKIIQKYGKINVNKDNIDELLKIANDEINYKNNDLINDFMLVKEIDNSTEYLNLEENWNIKKYEKSITKKNLKVNDKMRKLVKKIDKEVFEKYKDKIKNIFKEFLLTWSYEDLVMNDIIKIVINNLDYFTSKITNDIFIITEINIYLNIKNCSYYLKNIEDEYIIENYQKTTLNDLENQSINNIIHQSELNIDMDKYYKKRKISKNNNQNKLDIIDISKEDKIDDNCEDYKESELLINNKNSKKIKTDIYLSPSKLVSNNFYDELYDIEENDKTIINKSTIENYRIIIEDQKLSYVENFKDFNYEDIEMKTIQKKRINEDIKIINKNIINNEHSSIFVRISKSKKGMMRFMITGPNDTPYENGLFIFDLVITEDYPNSPPKVHFSNNGLKRFNPNLYDCGKVCLSLLGTWHGDESENWNKNISNIFQIFISIQSLILVGEPYYNEPGFEKEIGTEYGKRESKEYNEIIGKYTIKHTINDLIKDLDSINPRYEEFHDIIREHFSYKKNEILDNLIKMKDNVEKYDEYNNIREIYKSYNDYVEEYKKLINLL